MLRLLRFSKYQMFNTLFRLTCLIFVVHGLEDQSPVEVSGIQALSKPVDSRPKSESSADGSQRTHTLLPSSRLARLLLAFNPAAAFNVPKLLTFNHVQSSTASVLRSTSRHEAPMLRFLDYLPTQVMNPFNFFTAPDLHEDGAVVPHSELDFRCAPLGICVGGFREEQVALIAQAIKEVWCRPEGEMHQVPILLYAASDFKDGVKLRDILTQLHDRDLVPPKQGARLRVPHVLISGHSPRQTSLVVRAIRNLGLRAGTEHVSPMFSVTVPNAIDKPLCNLCKTLEGEYWENQPKVGFCNEDDFAP